ncbi:MAG: Do family serine endopeptidase [Ignavibacteriae bacterium]|nr:Do family serine endopeptidase [Ignavibacteriota bacterium]
MNKKSVLAAIFLVTIGIVFGAILVSSFKGGVEFGFAGDENVKLGAPSKLHDSNFDSKALGKSFVAVSKAVTPTVVYINVTTKGGSGDSKDGGLQEFFKHFGPDFKFENPEPQQGAGSGVIINPEGYILTNNHVVEGAADDGVEVILNDTRRLKATVVGTDPTTDLAVVKVDGEDLPTAALGNSDSLEVGEWVIAVGNPLGLQSTVTAGIVSFIGRNIGIIDASNPYRIENFIQTDAAINPGNSGGPLVNLYGEVVGINSAIATTNARYQGYGFAIPINLATAVASDIIKYGKVRRGYIGVSIRSVDETDAKALGLKNKHGVFIDNVQVDGAAAEAGLKDGDVILSIDGKEVNASNELQSMIAQHHPGDNVTLEIFRDGKTFKKSVTLRSRDAETVSARDSNPRKKESDEEEMPTKTASFEDIGFSVKNLTSQQKEDYEVENGVVVSDVKRFSEASNRSLRTGDVILEADKKQIKSVKDLKSVLENQKAGDAVLLRVKRREGTTNFITMQIPK